MMQQPRLEAAPPPGLTAVALVAVVPAVHHAVAQLAVHELGAQVVGAGAAALVRAVRTVHELVAARDGGHAGAVAAPEAVAAVCGGAMSRPMSYPWEWFLLTARGPKARPWLPVALPACSSSTSTPPPVVVVVDGVVVDGALCSSLCGSDAPSALAASLVEDDDTDLAGSPTAARMAATSCAVRFRWASVFSSGLGSGAGGGVEEDKNTPCTGGGVSGGGVGEDKTAPGGLAMAGFCGGEAVVVVDVAGEVVVDVAVGGVALVAGRGLDVVGGFAYGFEPSGILVAGFGGGFVGEAAAVFKAGLTEGRCVVAEGVGGLVEGGLAVVGTDFEAAGVFFAGGGGFFAAGLLEVVASLLEGGLKFVFVTF